MLYLILLNINKSQYITVNYKKVFLLLYNGSITLKVGAAIQYNSTTSHCLCIYLFSSVYLAGTVIIDQLWCRRTVFILCVGPAVSKTIIYYLFKSTIYLK